MRSSEKLDQLLPALAKARVKFGEIKKTQVNLHFGKKYADLSDILPEIVPALAAEGLVLLGTMEAMTSGEVEVTQRLMHVSEQYLESVTILSYPPGQLQKLGGDVSYFRRYAINTMLALSADEDLDDQTEPPVVSRRPARNPVPKDAPRESPMPAPMSPNGREIPAPSGKPTKEQVAEVWNLLIEVYPDAAPRDQIIREVMQIPVPQPYDLSRLRWTMTAAQHQELLKRVAGTVQEQANTREGHVVDVPLTPGPQSTDGPKAERLSAGEGGESFDSPATNLGDVSMAAEPSTRTNPTDVSEDVEPPWDALEGRAKAARLSLVTWKRLRQGSYAEAEARVEAMEPVMSDTAQDGI